jgi:hypothetical protein
MGVLEPRRTQTNLHTKEETRQGSRHDHCMRRLVVPFGTPSALWGVAASRVTRVAYAGAGFISERHVGL